MGVSAAAGDVRGMDFTFKRNSGSVYGRNVSRESAFHFWFQHDTLDCRIIWLIRELHQWLIEWIKVLLWCFLWLFSFATMDRSRAPCTGAPSIFDSGQKVREGSTTREIAITTVQCLFNFNSAINFFPFQEILAKQTPTLLPTFAEDGAANWAIVGQQTSNSALSALFFNGHLIFK